MNRTVSQTLAPKKDRVYGSKVNKPGSAKSVRSASGIKLADKTINSIKSILEKHKKESNKEVPLSVGKAVVRRGMGAYSNTHRPTISGGEPNSRVAWGLARLNAFLYKIKKGHSKSGKYSQDNDLIEELGYNFEKYADGGEVGKGKDIGVLDYVYVNTENNNLGIVLEKTQMGGDLYYVATSYGKPNEKRGHYRKSDLTLAKNNETRFYADGGNVENKETYKKWKSLVNMSKGELEKFYNSQEGKDAGLSSKEASEQGISSGRESARWVMKMKQTPMQEWTPTMWEWAKKQISFVSRMSGNKGGLYDDKGNKTRKHTSLLIWGHNPEKYEDGANIENKTKTNTMDKAIEVSTSEYKYTEFYEWFKNYIPSSLYGESWASEMKSLNTLILDNNVEEKITFTDSRLVLISFMALCQSDVTKGGMREWWIVRRYLEQYSDNNSIQGTDLFEFVDKYIGYTFTDANMSDEEKMRIETLKSVLSKHIKDDSIMIPYFVKSEIMSGVKEFTKEEIASEESQEDEIEEVSVEDKWQGLKDFAEMMMEDAEGEVLEKWQGLYEFCELMLEK